MIAGRQHGDRTYALGVYGRTVLKAYLQLVNVRHVHQKGGAL